MLTTGTFVALVASGLVAVIDWAAVLRGNIHIERIAKPAVMACLILAVLVALPGVAAARWLLVVALAASLAGDWLLLTPVRFTAGLVAFLLAHLAYMALFVLGTLEIAGGLVGVVLAIAVLAGVGRRILAGARAAGAGPAVGVYLTAICAMAVAATASGSVLAALGAWLFVTSDAMLGWDRFVALPAATAGAAACRRVMVMVTYHAAQALLTIAVLRLAV